MLIIVRIKSSKLQLITNVECTIFFNIMIMYPCSLVKLLLISLSRQTSHFLIWNGIFYQFRVNDHFSYVSCTWTLIQNASWNCEFGSTFFLFIIYLQFLSIYCVAWSDASFSHVTVSLIMRWLILEIESLKPQIFVSH